MLAGYAEIDITPDPGEEMTGYGYFLNRRGVGTLDPLTARALSLGDGQAKAVIVQIDLLGLSKEFVADVRAEAQGRFGLPPECLMLHCTHTHSGPATVWLFGCGTPSEYVLTALCAKLLTVIERVLADLRPVSATRRFAGGFPEGFAFNRTGGTDRDTDVRGVQIELGGARPILVLSYACHPVTLGVNREYSADYPAYLLREFNAYGVRALYLNGCCGDIDPVSNAYRWGSGTCDTLRIYGRDLAAAARRAMEKMEAWAPGPLRAVSRMVPLEARMPDAAELRRALDEHRGALRQNPNDVRKRVDVMWHERMLRLTESGALQEAMRAEIQAIGCGDVVFVGLSAETFTRLGWMIREAVPQRHLMIAATSNGVLGYIATPEDAEKRAYASFGACKAYGMPLPALDAGVKWAAEGGRIVQEAVEGP